MTEATVFNELISFIESFCEILSLIHSKYRTEFFVSKFFAEFYALNFTNEDFSAFGNGYTCKFSNLNGRLTNDFSVKRAVDDDGLANFLGFSRIQEITTTGSKFFFYCIVDAF